MERVYDQTINQLLSEVLSGVARIFLLIKVYRDNIRTIYELLVRQA